MAKRYPNKKGSKKSEKSFLPSQNPAFTIFDILARGQLVSQGVFIVAKLRIPDYLRDGAKTVVELANITKVHPNALFRLLRMLASVGIFREIIEAVVGGEQNKQNSTRRFELTPAASLLLSETRNSIRDFALLFGLDSFNKLQPIFCMPYKLVRTPSNMQTVWRCISISNKNRTRLMLRYLIMP